MGASPFFKSSNAEKTTLVRIKAHAFIAFTPFHCAVGKLSLNSLASGCCRAAVSVEVAKTKCTNNIWKRRKDAFIYS